MISILVIFAMQALFIIFFKGKLSDMDGKNVEIKSIDFLPIVGIFTFFFRYMTNFD